MLNIATIGWLVGVFALRNADADAAARVMAATPSRVRRFRVVAKRLIFGSWVRRRPVDDVDIRRQPVRKVDCAQ